MSLLKNGWNLKYIKKYLETVETVITSDKLLLTPDLSQGLIFYKLSNKSSKYFKEKKN